MLRKLIAAGWLLASTILFLYSFTQVDLGLTLTKTSIWQGIQRSFQYIGYFDRGLSSVLFVVIVLLFFAMYFLTLHVVRNGLLQRRQVWAIIISVGVILFLAYNAFSYDLFNYIFDAKIVTIYHQNPYTHAALDFPQDKMLGFMHWTQRVYPYGPVWLGISIPLSFIGMGLFLPTFYLFKLLALVAYLGAVYFIEKILKKLKSKDVLFGTVFFALNPLVLIEFLVSAHNDVTMMFLAMASIYFLIERRYVLSIVFLILSIGIKFATVFMIPPYLLFMYYSFRQSKVEFSKILQIALVFMIIPIILATLRTNFQPWYLLYALPFTAFMAKKYFIFIPTIIISLISVLNYLPFLFTGNWNPPIPNILWGMVFGSLILSGIIVFVYYLRYNKALSARK